MDNKFSILKIESNEEEFNGVWRKEHVEEDMEDFGMDPIGNEWIDYIISRIFENEPEAVIKTVSSIGENDSIINATVELNDGTTVKIIKIWR